MNNTTASEDDQLCYIYLLYTLTLHIHCIIFNNTGRKFFLVYKSIFTSDENSRHGYITKMKTKKVRQSSSKCFLNLT